MSQCFVPLFQNGKMLRCSYELWDQYWGVVFFLKKMLLISRTAAIAVRDTTRKASDRKPQSLKMPPLSPQHRPPSQVPPSPLLLSKLPPISLFPDAGFQKASQTLSDSHQMCQIVMDGDVSCLKRNSFSQSGTITSIWIQEPCAMMQYVGQFRIWTGFRLMSTMSDCVRWWIGQLLGRSCCSFKLPVSLFSWNYCLWPWRIQLYASRLNIVKL